MQHVNRNGYLFPIAIVLVGPHIPNILGGCAEIAQTFVLAELSNQGVAYIPATAQPNLFSRQRNYINNRDNEKRMH